MHWLKGKSLIALSLAMACGPVNFTGSKAKEAWDGQNAPERLGRSSFEYEWNFEKLPTSGFISKIPWRGSYWPSHTGGVAYRWNLPSEMFRERVAYEIKSFENIPKEDIIYLSPIEKLDIYLGNKDFKLTREERRRTGVDKGQGHFIPKWHGLCHALAPASILFENPSPVDAISQDGQKIPFGAADIKALLIYALHHSKSASYYASIRCREDSAALKEKLEHGQITYADYARIMESPACKGINPGSFHMILSNFIGIKGESFLADLSRDVQVWNFSLQGYTSRVLEERTDNFSQNASTLTHSEVHIISEVNFTPLMPSSYAREEVKPSKQIKTYEYWLELDKNRNIVGGTWVSEQRPDFLWRKEMPNFEGIYEKIYELYQKSIDPLNEQAGVKTVITPFYKLQVQNNPLHYTLELKGKAPSDIKSILIEIFDSKNKLYKSLPVPISFTRAFELKKLIPKWKAGKVLLHVVNINKQKIVLEERNF